MTLALHPAIGAQETLIAFVPTITPVCTATGTFVICAMIQEPRAAAVIRTSTPAIAAMGTTAASVRLTCATNALMLVLPAVLALLVVTTVSVPKVSPAGTVRIPLLKTSQSIGPLLLGQYRARAQDSKILRIKTSVTPMMQLHRAGVIFF